MASPEEILQANFEQAEKEIARSSPGFFAMTLQTLDNERHLETSVLERMEAAASDKTLFRTKNFFSDERTPEQLAYDIYAKIAKEPI